MSFLLGLTGGIGMGKSTAAKMFRDLGHPVWDADATVHRLYAKGGAAVGPVGAVFPAALVDAAVDRSRLRQALTVHPDGFAVLERIVHPLVVADRADFITANFDGALIILDIPLLFETGADAAMDGVAVVSTDEATRRARILARGTMDEQTLDLIIARQTPDAEKRTRADWIIPSDTLEGARRAIQGIVAQILAGQA
ncbi:MAG: dephospho-CoA kinase [Paracoccus denitrificans]|nr:MAG: dephospho-CoA kinase [Paracoccus denitrificans]PZO85613.1 MAG: dephospho-CoA kinase [Paracoccus denitrificans]